jgi:hypothetical protein
MEALDINDVKHAVVGDIVANSWGIDGRAHALVVGRARRVVSKCC